MVCLKYNQTCTLGHRRAMALEHQRPCLIVCLLQPHPHFKYRFFSSIMWRLHAACVINETHDMAYQLCPLHIRRSDAPIGLRCSRRQFGTKPSDVASAHHSHWPNGAQCVHSRRLVRGSRTILYNSLVGTVKESYLLQLSVALYTFGSQSAGVQCQIIPHARSSPIR